MSTDNPYAIQLAELVKAAGGITPPGYIGRLYFHIAATSLVFLLSIVYLSLSYREHVNRGRKLKLIRLHRLRSGNLIVLNTLFMFVIFVALSSIIFIVQKWWQLRIFVNKKLPYDLVILICQSWTGPLLGGWCYIFSNAAAALSTGRGGVGLDGGGRLLTSLHNASFVGVLVFYFATTIPLSYYANKAQNAVIDASLVLMAALDAASKIPDPSMVPEALIAAIAQAASDIKSRNDTYYKLFRGLVGIATFMAIALGIIAVLSLTFVLKVRKQSQWHQTRTQISNSVFVNVEERTIAENPDGTVDTSNAFLQQHPAATRPVTTFVGNRDTVKNAKAKLVSQQQKDVAALHRLARDLSVSTPLGLLLAAFMISCGIAGVIRIDRPHSWAEVELLLDGYTFAWSPIHIVILSCFIFNLTYHPYSHGIWSAHKNSQTGTATAIGNNALSIQLQAYPAPLDAAVSDIDLNGSEKASAGLDEKAYEWENVADPSMLFLV